MKKLLLILLLTVIIGLRWAKSNIVASRSYQPTTPPAIEEADLFGGVSYVPVDADAFAVSFLAQNLRSPTRLRIVPDGSALFVTQITGEVLAFRRTPDGWSNSPELVTKIDTKFPGFPPDEAGLVSIIFSHRFQKDHRAFLLYTFKDQDGKTQNRVSSFRVWDVANRFIATKPKLVYQANVPGTGSHQITDGVSLDIEGAPHLLFAIGEGFDGKRAQNPSEESGKLILIQHDGSIPLGPRPFPEHPRVQALGIRNAYVIERDRLYQDRFFIADTGPDHFDRILYTKVVSLNSEKLQPINFGWDGNEESLNAIHPDPNIATTQDMAILRLLDTRTITGLVTYVHPRSIGIPPFRDDALSILATVFGKTGYTSNEPGKEIWLGIFSHFKEQPTLTFEPIITRIPEADGKYGNPIGLTVDPLNGDIFFADIMEGRVYWVKVTKKPYSNEQFIDEILEL